MYSKMCAILKSYLRVAWLSFLLSPGLSLAYERHFSYLYESPVLPKGAMEIELWTTPRLMRDHYFVRFDERLEFEVGLGKGLQTAFYLNMRGQAESSSQGMQKKFEFRGVSSEWKWQMTDPVSNFLGSSLYGELTWMPHEVELEGKIILDKWIGRVLVAYNLVGEFEIEAEQKQGEELEWEKVAVVENILGVSVRIFDGLQVGLEFLNKNRLSEGKLDYSALFIGPNVFVSSRKMWATLTFLAQLPSIKKSDESPHKWLELKDLERYQARLLLGYHF